LPFRLARGKFESTNDACTDLTETRPDADRRDRFSFYVVQIGADFKVATIRR